MNTKCDAIASRCGQPNSNRKYLSFATEQWLQFLDNLEGLVVLEQIVQAPVVVFIVQNWTTDEFFTNKDLEVTSAETKNFIGPTCKPIKLVFIHVDDNLFGQKKICT